MTYFLDVLNDESVDEALVADIKNAAETALDHLSVPPSALSVLITDNARLQELNLEFRQVDSPTDVLSFPTNDELPGEDGPFLYLGDIAISVNYAENQAKANGHSLSAEMQLLTIHGVLHLLGYDHYHGDEKEEMWDIQSQILAKLGLQNIMPTEN